MSKHTPGPWGTRPHSHYLQVVTDRGLSEDSIAICDLFHRRTTDPLPVAEHEANARLIAAAPRMARFIEQARDYLICGDPDEGSMLMQEAEEILIEAGLDAEGTS